MGRLVRRTSIILALAIAAFGASPTRAAQPVDLLLVLAADVSRSIDSQKFVQTIRSQLVWRFNWNR